MIKVVVFDADGMVIHNSHAQRFSLRFAKQYGVGEDKILPFFENEFQDCLVGKADLKKELEKYAPEWGWRGTIDELLDFWFSGEAEVDEKVVEVIRELKQKGINCYLATNNEKYRTDYITEKLGLGQIFVKIFSAGYMGCKKPQTEFYDYILNEIGFKKDEIVFWDDQAEELEDVKKQGYMIEKYTDFTSFKNRIMELKLP